MCHSDPPWTLFPLAILLCKKFPNFPEPRSIGSVLLIEADSAVRSSGNTVLRGTAFFLGGRIYEVGIGDGGYGGLRTGGK